MKIVMADIVLITASGETKQLHNESISIDKKEIYIGSRSNWRIRWKDVESVDVADDEVQRQSVKMLANAGNVRELKYYSTRREHYTGALWQEAIDFLHKCWKKQQQKNNLREMEEDEDTSPTTTTTARPSRSIRPVSTKSALSSSNREPFGRQRRGVYGSRNQRNNNSIVPYKPLTFRSIQSQLNNTKKKKNRPVDVSIYQSDSDGDVDQQVQPEDNSSDQESQVKEEHAIEQVEYDPMDQQAETDTASHDSDIEPQQRQPQRRRLKKKFPKKHLPTGTEQDSSDDEDPFSPIVPVTTPSAQRVVSPAEADDETGDAEEDNNERPPPKTTVCSNSIARFFAPRPKSSSSTESTADKALKTHGRFSTSSTVNTTDNKTPKIQSRLELRIIDSLSERKKTPVLEAKLLSPLRKDNDWLSQQPLQSPMATAASSDEVATPLSATTADNFSSPPPKRSNEETVDPQISVRKRLRYSGFKRNQPPRLSLEFDDTDDKPTWASLTRDNADKGNDSNGFRSTAALSNPRSYWKGLRNMGNSCYLNASLQMLLSVGNFVSALAKGSWVGQLTNSIVSVSNSLTTPPTPYSRSPDAKPVKAAIDQVTDKFAGYLQRDAHEFLSDLLDQVHIELEASLDQPREHVEDEKLENLEQPSLEDHAHEINTTAQQELQKETGNKAQRPNLLPTDEFFRLNLQVQLKCESCGYTRSKEELYRHLSLDVASQSGGDVNVGISGNIQTSLDKFFEPTKVEIKCEKCESGDHAIQTLRVLSQPKALLLHLKRFVVVERRIATPPAETTDENADNHTNKSSSPLVSLTFQKNRSRVEIPEQVTLDPFRLVQPQTTESQQCNYNLVSIVHHIGNTASSGHYTAHAKRSRPDTIMEDSSSDQWVSFDDSVTKEATVAEVVSSIRSQRTAYMLMYVLSEI